jgi:hypothetical protein
VRLHGSHSQQNQQVGNLVPPPLAAAIGRELRAAAGDPLSDDWAARAVGSFEPLSHWGAHAHATAAVARGEALPDVRYIAANNDELGAVAARLGLLSAASLLVLNRPTFADLASGVKLRNTKDMKVLRSLALRRHWCDDSWPSCCRAGRAAATNPTVRRCLCTAPCATPGMVLPS